jgi:hypothetical protein
LPQFALSVFGFTQTAAPPSFVHSKLLLGHDAAHAPATHACPAGHVVPHLPQLSVSLWRSTHESTHAIFVPVHSSVATGFAQLATITATNAATQRKILRTIPDHNLAENALGRDMHSALDHPHDALELRP